MSASPLRDFENKYTYNKITTCIITGLPCEDDNNTNYFSDMF